MSAVRGASNARSIASQARREVGSNKSGCGSTRNEEGKQGKESERHDGGLPD
jgi:hypothetical protein